MPHFADLLRHELAAALDMERRAGALLADLAHSAPVPLGHALGLAEQGSRRRRAHLAAAFAALGEPARGTHSAGMEGIAQERAQHPPAAARVHDAWLAVRAHRYLTTVYEEALDLADRAKLPAVAEALEEALAEAERATAAALDAATEAEEAVAAEGPAS